MDVLAKRLMKIAEDLADDFKEEVEAATAMPGTYAFLIYNEMTDETWGILSRNKATAQGVGREVYALNKRQGELGEDVWPEIEDLCDRKGAEIVGEPLENLQQIGDDWFAIVDGDSVRLNVVGKIKGRF